MPLVTTIIPSYNHAQYIDVAIQSVLEQTYSEMELIVVDDGSVDETHSVLEKYRGDPRVKLMLNTKNRGQSAVLKEALEEASGEFIGFLPSDDWYLPQKTELQIAKFEQSDDSVGVVYGRGARYFESSGETVEVDLPRYRGDVAERLLGEGNFVYPVTPLYRRQVFDLEIFDERYRAEGESILAKIALHFTFEFVTDVVGVMRDHDYNIGKDVELMYRENIAYWSEFFDNVNMPTRYRQLKSVRLSRIHRLKGLELITKRRAFSKGRAALLKAVQLRWGYLLDRRVLMGLALCSIPSGVSSALIENKVRRRKQIVRCGTAGRCN